jgi:hypothetical protein
MTCYDDPQNLFNEPECVLWSEFQYIIATGCKFIYL